MRSPSLAKEQIFQFQNSSMRLYCSHRLDCDSEAKWILEHGCSYSLGRPKNLSLMLANIRLEGFNIVGKPRWRGATNAQKTQ